MGLFIFFVRFFHAGFTVTVRHTLNKSNTVIKMTFFTVIFFKVVMDVWSGWLAGFTEVGFVDDGLAFGFWCVLIRNEVMTFSTVEGDH